MPSRPLVPMISSCILMQTSWFTRLLWLTFDVQHQQSCSHSARPSMRNTIWRAGWVNGWVRGWRRRRQQPQPQQHCMRSDKTTRSRGLRAAVSGIHRFHNRPPAKSGFPIVYQVASGLDQPPRFPTLSHYRAFRAVGLPCISHII